jgi:hypothetical protein
MISTIEVPAEARASPEPAQNCSRIARAEVPEHDGQIARDHPNETIG